MTPRRPEEPEDNDPRDLEDREDYLLVNDSANTHSRHTDLGNAPGQYADQDNSLNPSSSRPNRFSGPNRSSEDGAAASNSPGPIGAFIDRIGMTATLGAAAAILTAGVALFNAFHSRNGTPPDAPPRRVVAGFLLSDYWSGIPSGTTQPLIFHLLTEESPAASLPALLPGTLPGSAPLPANSGPSRSTEVSGTLRNPCQGDAVIQIDSGSWDGRRLTILVSSTGTGHPLTIDVQRIGDHLEGTAHQDAFRGPIILHRGEIPCNSH
ncbi:MAG: hypothetical protein PW789_04800 [Edaphobacter sp.]|uniref:hypothetical protein n=1 Tax=Edaphobacter sp. TaxID=1934404 RepID=UPI00238F233D|nr:hypothetical protein [Edaphobacter sp.]MDE1175906.1 hypothetical protein [Edaphobacter sp.]